ncbi:hypothetical protein GIB67_010547 [Kingdonia uniflora]|uniref:cellulose synthase (UDP-forming) n=1 Tax=Kingdonia uniflora TaxID=39325 RepID=A0A7J7MAQ8_9MAGN|nr:hypothetical protein GIB67_010547 [Kingdonia uniflora]
MDDWKTNQGNLGNDYDEVVDSDMQMNDEAREPLSRKVPIASSRINPYRMVIVIRLVVLGFFLRYRILNPVHDAIGLWLTSVVCEIWFALSWILDQFPKWFPIDRETYLDRLSLRYEREGEPSMLSPLDIFVSTVDPLKEPPLVTGNTVLSILAMDYPVDKISCYVSDDGASMLTFESLSETAEFARKWVPFCKKFEIEPRAPEMYFSLKIDYLKDKVQPTFVKERRAMKEPNMVDIADTFLCNSMIKAYSDNRQFSESITLYRDLCRNETWGLGFCPDTYTYPFLFKSCGSGLAFKEGYQLYSQVLKMALIVGYARYGDMGMWRKLFDGMFEKDSVAFNAMIDGYVKEGNVNGDLAAARSFFDAMPEKNLVSWNTIIGGYCQNKKPHVAMELFRKMQLSSSFEPDEVTIVSILPAVADLGALDFGGWIHEYVRRKKDVTRAEKVMRSAFKMEPWNDGNYVMMRNLYARERRWRDVEEVKGLMRKNRAKREAGCSVIKVDSTISEFVSGDRVHPQLKREYEEFKIRINALVAKALKVPPGGWIMQDGTPWPGNNTRDHPGMIQVFLGHSGGHDTEGNELPRLVYVSREKRPGFHHHKKAGAMNALVRVSAVLTNAPFMLNLDCDHYINNSKAAREAMCFLMDPQIGRKVCYVQFPQRFDGIDRNDRYANRNTVFFDINMKGLDGIQGPVYVGTGCVFRRQALYGYEPPKGPKRPKMVSCDCCPCFGRRKKLKYSKHFTGGADVNGKAPGLDDDKELMMSQMNFEKKFGQSATFVTSTLMEQGGVPPSSSPAALLKEAIHVISCGYEDKTEWGTELGWIYGSITEDILTGFKMHCRGWRSIYCMPKRPAFKGSAPINLSDRLNQVLRWALGSVEIFFSRHSPLLYGYKGGNLKWLERFAYINTTIYPFTSLPLLAYCTLPAICLLTGKFIMPTISTFASLFFISLFISIFATGILELRWSGVSIEEWWRNEQFWVIGGVSAHLFAVVQGLLKVLVGIDTNFTVTSKTTDDDDFGELYAFKWTTLLIPPTTLLIINLVGVVAGISDAISNGYDSWGPLFGKLFFAFWVIVHLYPFLKGLMGRQNRTPTIVIIWSVLLASIFSLLWVRIDPFILRTKGPDVKQCGINC